MFWWALFWLFHPSRWPDVVVPEMSVSFPQYMLWHGMDLSFHLEISSWSIAVSFKTCVMWVRAYYFESYGTNRDQHKNATQTLSNMNFTQNRDVFCKYFINIFSFFFIKCIFISENKIINRVLFKAKWILHCWSVI